MKTTTLAIDLLRIDGNTQSRVAINQDAVGDYAELIESSKEWPFPPLDVFHDGAEYFVADGFHRYLASQRVKRGSLPCRVHQGTAWDALLFAMTANDTHGLRMTAEDKRRCVELLLDNGAKLTQAEIATKAGVGKRLVQKIVAERKEEKAHRARSNGGGGDSSSGPGHRAETEHQADESLVAHPSDDTVSVAATAQEESSFSGPSPSDKCPNCAGTKWTDDDEGWACAKCCHPYGEPAGDVDDDRINTQRQKTVKTAEALMRAFDDLQFLKPKEIHASTITCCKGLVTTAKGWK